MRIVIIVFQAKNLPITESFVKLQAGKYESRTKILKDTSNPIWGEDFAFEVTDAKEDEDVVVSVFQHERDQSELHPNVSTSLLGKVLIPLSSVAAQENQIMLPTWFDIEDPSDGEITMDCGKILLSVTLQGKFESISDQMDINLESVKEHEGRAKDLVTPKDGRRRDGKLESVSEINLGGVKEHGGQSKDSSSPKMGKRIMKNLSSRFDKLLHKKEGTSKRLDDELSVESVNSNYEDTADRSSVSTTTGTSFEEGLEFMKSIDRETEEMPGNLLWGVLLDEKYLVSPCDLNKFLFSPGSQFRKDLAELQRLTDIQEGPWSVVQEDNPRLTRDVAYMTCKTTLVKSVRATENQVYLKANGKQFAVFVSVSTPDVTCGDTFKLELLYKILPETADGEFSRLIISWGLNFHKSTLMKSVIEGGAKKGLTASFKKFADLLGNSYQTLDSAAILSDNREQVLVKTPSVELSLEKTDLKSALRYFLSFPVVGAVLLSAYVVVHILHCDPRKIQAFEFYLLDLPDTLGEVLSTGILVLLLRRVYEMYVHFIQDRRDPEPGRDQLGVRANNDKGWILRVALINGTNLASLEAAEPFDPYVVFTCNGKTRTSTVKLQEIDPQWNELIEFDAMEDPPSVLDVGVFDYDGPFDLGDSIGHVEIKFLKHTAAELADICVPLVGSHAEANQSKLQLKIFLENKNGVESIKDFLSKVVKETGKKMIIRPPHKTSAFQKLFSLTQDEFLLKEYTCYLRRQLPVQGKIYLSARIVAFSSTILGPKFYFHWDDIDDIQEHSATFASAGSQLLYIILKRNRGLDAKHGAKSLDEEGRLLFHFQSFVSFGVTSKTIKALWKTRMLSVEHRARIVEAEYEDAEVLQDMDGLKLVYKYGLPIDVESVMNIFGGGEMERKVMKKSGCVNYECTAWESKDTTGIYVRRVSYKYGIRASVFLGGVTCEEQKLMAPNGDGWILYETMTFHDVPFADCFRVHLRYEVKKSAIDSIKSKCDVYMKIRWRKPIQFEQRISQIIMDKFRRRFKVLFDLFYEELYSSS